MAKRKQKNPPSPATVADRLHSAAIHLLRLMRKQDASSGEGPARLSALSVLVFVGPMTLSRLAATEQVKPPTMSRIVGALERSGLVEIAPNDRDARSIRIKATARGTQLLQEARQRRISALATQLQSLSGPQLDILKRAAELMEQLSRKVGESEEE